MPSGSTYRPCEGVTSYLLGEDLLVHAGDGGDMFVLDEHARLLFEAVSRHGRFEEIVHALSSGGFEDDPSLPREIDRALEEMRAQGLVTVEHAEGS